MPMLTIIIIIITIIIITGKNSTYAQALIKLFANSPKRKIPFAIKKST